MINLATQAIILLWSNYPNRLEVCVADIANENRVEEILNSFVPDSLINLAAESHVDNSITSSLPFIESNILDTYTLPEAKRKYLSSQSSVNTEDFLFHHVSTDEVFGDQEDFENSANELHKYYPSSQYSASKACSDHLVTAWGRT